MVGGKGVSFMNRQSHLGNKHFVKNTASGGDTATSPDQLTMRNVIFNSVLIAVAETMQ